MLGPYKKRTAGIADFETMKDIITENFGLKFTSEGAEKDPMLLEPHEIAQIKDAFNRSMGGEKEKANDTLTYLLYGGYEPLTVTLTHILNQKAGIGWTSYSHTGVPVTTSAYGVGAEIFNGYYDNTDAALKIMSVMGMDPRPYYAEADASYRVAVNF